MPVSQMSPANRRYVIRFISTMSAYAVLLATVIFYLVRFRPTGPIVYFLAVLPALPIIGVIVVVGLYLREEKDEFQRALIERSLLWGMGGTLAVTSVWGFLEMFSRIPHLNPFYNFALFWVFVGIASIVLRLQYRSGDE